MVVGLGARSGLRRKTPVVAWRAVRAPPAQLCLCTSAYAYCASFAFPSHSHQPTNKCRKDRQHDALRVSHFAYLGKPTAWWHRFALSVSSSLPFFPCATNASSAPTELGKVKTRSATTAESRKIFHRFVLAIYDPRNKAHATGEATTRVHGWMSVLLQLAAPGYMMAGSKNKTLSTFYRQIF
jgi:hypothetical protein